MAQLAEHQVQHAADAADSIPQCSRGCFCQIGLSVQQEMFLPDWTFSADSLNVFTQRCMQSHALTFVHMLKIQCINICAHVKNPRH